MVKGGFCNSKLPANFVSSALRRLNNNRLRWGKHRYNSKNYVCINKRCLKYTWQTDQLNDNDDDKYLCTDEEKDSGYQYGPVDDAVYKRYRETYVQYATKRQG